MNIMYAVVLAVGALAPNYTLEDVHNRRNELYQAELPTAGFVCRLGVQHQYADYIGKNLYFYDIEYGRLYGPMLVVDVAESGSRMRAHDLAADIGETCSYLWSRHGILFELTDNPRIDLYSIPSSQLLYDGPSPTVLHTLLADTNPGRVRASVWVAYEASLN